MSDGLFHHAARPAATLPSGADPVFGAASLPSAQPPTGDSLAVSFCGAGCGGSTDSAPRRCFGGAARASAYPASLVGGGTVKLWKAGQCGAVPPSYLICEPGGLTSPKLQSRPIVLAHVPAERELKQIFSYS